MQWNLTLSLLFISFSKGMACGNMPRNSGSHCCCCCGWRQAGLEALEAHSDFGRHKICDQWAIDPISGRLLVGESWDENLQLCSVCSPLHIYILETHRVWLCTRFLERSCQLLTIAADTACNKNCAASRMTNSWNRSASSWVVVVE